MSARNQTIKTNLLRSWIAKFPNYRKIIAKFHSLEQFSVYNKQRQIIYIKQNMPLNFTIFTETFAKVPENEGNKRFG